MNKLLLEYPSTNDYFIFLIDENNKLLSDMLEEYQVLKDSRVDNRELSEEIKYNLLIPLKIFKFFNTVGKQFLYKALKKGFLFAGYDEDKEVMQFEKDDKWYSYKEVKEIIKGARRK